MLFLSIWSVATLGVAIFTLQSDSLPRSAAPVLLPLLIAGAFMITDILSVTADSPRPAPIRAFNILFLLALAILWPAAVTFRQTLDWKLAPIPAEINDRSDGPSLRLAAHAAYLGFLNQSLPLAADIDHEGSSASSGVATRAAHLFLLKKALDGPITVLLPSTPGHPADSLRILLNKPGIRDLITLRDLPASPHPSNSLQLPLSSDTNPSYLILADPSPALGGAIPDDVLMANPQSTTKPELVAVFSNLNDAKGNPSDAFIRIYLLQ